VGRVSLLFGWCSRQEIAIHPLLRKLTGGDRRSLGRANEVVVEVLARPALFRALFQGLKSDDAVVRMRAADAIEKITLGRPDLLVPYKRKLLEIAAATEQKEVRWHMALMLPRLGLGASERAAAVDILYEYMKDTGSIVKTLAMQGLWDFAGGDRKLMARVLPLIEEMTETGTPAMRARGRKLLKRLKKAETEGERTVRLTR
jgi:HEAT repeat protein